MITVTENTYRMVQTFTISRGSKTGARAGLQSGLPALAARNAVAIALCAQGHAENFALIIGCMVGSSLSMAPATLIAQAAAYVDLDGPLLLAEDRAAAMHYDAQGIHPPAAALWG